MKYKYICVVIMTIYYVYYICHMYHIHVHSMAPRKITTMNITQPIVPSILKAVSLTHHNVSKHYSYHKQTLSLFYKKRREGQRHIL
jgi:hypothetical protein